MLTRRPAWLSMICIGLVRSAQLRRVRQQSMGGSRHCCLEGAQPGAPAWAAAGGKGEAYQPNRKFILRYTTALLLK